MSLTIIWAYFALLAVVMGLVALPLFRFVDSTPIPGTRNAPIDGLRGFLALSVFVFHLIVTYRFVETGIWEPPAPGFYAMLGPIGVSLFFMITGFLFWGKLLRERGRPRWHALYVGRFFRIVPMYLFVVLAMFFVVFARTGFELHEPAGAVASSMLQWLALGMVDTQPDINGLRATHLLAGVTWTIAYEWAFYASLIVTAYFARGELHLLFVSVALATCLAGKLWLGIDAIGFALLFACGMASASLLHANKTIRLSQSTSSILAISCLTAIFSISSSGYGTVAAALLAIFFYLICSGTTLFGLLTTTPARRLGTISYSLYLMQGLVLTLVFSIDPVRSFAMTNPLNYWVAGIAGAAVLLLCAALGYAWVEKPGIALGKRLVRRHTPAAEPQQHFIDTDRVV